MGGHGVPHAARGKLGHAHLQLARGQHLAYEHLVDVALVAHLERTHVGHHGVGLGHLLAGVCRVGRHAVEVELGGLAGVLAGEHHVAVAAAHVESLLVAEGERLVAHLHRAFAQSDVVYANLAARGEVLGLQRVDGLELKLLVHGHCPAHDHAVVHGVHHVHLVGGKHLLNKEVAADALGVVTLSVLGMGRITDFVICLHKKVPYVFVCSGKSSPCRARATARNPCRRQRSLHSVIYNNVAATAAQASPTTRHRRSLKPAPPHVPNGKDTFFRPTHKIMPPLFSAAVSKFRNCFNFFVQWVA